MYIVGIHKVDGIMQVGIDGYGENEGCHITNKSEDPLIWPKPEIPIKNEHENDGDDDAPDSTFDFDRGFGLRGKKVPVCPYRYEYGGYQEDKKDYLLDP